MIFNENLEIISDYIELHEYAEYIDKLIRQNCELDLVKIKDVDMSSLFRRFSDDGKSYTLPLQSSGIQYEQFLRDAISKSSKDILCNLYVILREKLEGKDEKYEKSVKFLLGLSLRNGG